MSGRIGLTDLDEFSENFRKGGGSFPIQKNSLQIFLVILREKNNEFSGKGGGSLQSENFCCRF